MVADTFRAVALGVIEGVTEFIPVSSTGHLIVASRWLDMGGERGKTFDIFIQLGAILAIVWLYRAQLWQTARSATADAASRRFAVNLGIAFLPAALVGVVVHDWIKATLFTPTVVGAAFVIGGIVILLLEWWRPPERVGNVGAVAPVTALGIGLAQVLSLIPGTSRSGATIMGGYALGLSRVAATEFSFFLAIPIMVAATLYDLLKSWQHLTSADVAVFGVGFAVSFIAAVVVVRGFIRYVGHHSFAAFAWYRIAFGALLLAIAR